MVPMCTYFSSGYMWYFVSVEYFLDMWECEALYHIENLKLCIRTKSIGLPHLSPIGFGLDAQTISYVFLNSLSKKNSLPSFLLIYQTWKSYPSYMVYLSFIPDGVNEQWQQQPPKIGKLESYKARKLQKLEI